MLARPRYAIRSLPTDKSMRSDGRTPTSISTWPSDQELMRRMRAETLMQSPIDPTVTDLMRAGLRAMADLSVDRRTELIERARNERGK